VGANQFNNAVDWLRKWELKALSTTSEIAQRISLIFDAWYEPISF